MVGFYLLAVGLSLTLLWIAWMTVKLGHAGGFKVALLAAAAGGTVLLSLRPRRHPFHPPGPPITHAQHPRLFDVLEDVARATNQKMPATVYVSPDLNAAVLHHGGVLGLGGRRTMILGLPLLHVVTVDQVKAILAHEFGHFSGGDTRIGRLVYQTRAGLVRTLAAVEGDWLETLFSFYAKIVMRISMAVSRQQEFAADAFAARVISTQDIIDGLRISDRTGSYLSMFFLTNVLPIVQAGYRPPIGSGFAAYSALMPSTPMREHREVDAQDAVHDSHPPLEDRIAALEALGSNPARVSDTRAASALLTDTWELEGRVYTLDESRGRRLKFIEWSQVTERVMIPYWRQTVEERRATLRAVTIEALPTSPTGIMKLVRSTADLKLKLLDDPEILGVVVHAITAGVALRLIEQGWTPVSASTSIGTLARNDETLEVVAVVHGVLLGTTPLEYWAAICRRHNLSGPLA